MSVARCQREVDSTEFAWWRAYDRIQPLGPERLEFQVAQLAAFYLNAHAEKNADPVSPYDLMPFSEKPAANPAGPSPEETLAVFRAL